MPDLSTGSHEPHITVHRLSDTVRPVYSSQSSCLRLVQEIRWPWKKNWLNSCSFMLAWEKESEAVQKSGLCINLSSGQWHWSAPGSLLSGSVLLLLYLGHRLLKSSTYRFLIEFVLCCHPSRSSFTHSYTLLLSFVLTPSFSFCLALISKLFK